MFVLRFRSGCGRGSGREELEQVVVELLLVRIGDAVRRAGVHPELRAGHALRGPPAADREGNVLVVVTVGHQRGYVDLVEVGSEVGRGECGDALIGVAGTCLQALEPEGVPHSSGGMLTLAVVPEERP